MKKPRYRILTYDVPDWTPEFGIGKKTFTLFGLRKASKILKDHGYEGLNDPSVYVESVELPKSDDGLFAGLENE